MPYTQPTHRSKPSARPRGEPVEIRPSARAPVARGVFDDPSLATTTRTSGVRLRPATDGAVLVTGICGRLGKLLARELHRSDSVVGVDRRPFIGRPKDIVHHQVDMRRKKMKDIFRGRNIRAVIHVGALHDPRRSDRDRHSWNIVGFQKLLEYMAQYEVPKLVVLSGANVYGPQSSNPQFLTEDAPLLGAQHFGGMRDLVELDMLAQSFFWKHPSSETVILRPCHIIGRVRNAASNYLRLDRPVTIMGFDPMMQVVHEKDVIRAIQLALRPGVRGIYNIRGPGELPLSHLVRSAGGRPWVLPSPLARLALDQLWRLRLSNFPSQELDHLRYVCMVDDARAREELGYEPTYSIDRALRDLRRVRYTA
jgi:UDP-glucose 4-epimerase